MYSESTCHAHTHTSMTRPHTHTCRFCAAALGHTDIGRAIAYEAPEAEKERKRVR